MTIVVHHKSRWRRVLHLIYCGLSYVGEIVVTRPSKLFYGLLSIGAIIQPPFGVFILLCVLCGLYRRRLAG